MVCAKNIRIAIVLLAGLLVASARVSATPTPLTDSFSVLPSGGNVQGAPGSEVGWGYSITNDDPTNWLVATNLTSTPFSNGTPDASFFDYPIVSPLTTVTVAFDPVAQAGLFGFSWDANAPVGFSNTGVFTLGAEWWTGDPFATGAFLQTAADQTAGYSVTVSAASVNPVPEPGSVVLLMSGLSVLMLKCRKGGRNSNRLKSVFTF
jgi:hypothetical protein